MVTSDESAALIIMRVCLCYDALQVELQSGDQSDSKITHFPLPENHHFVGCVPVATTAVYLPALQQARN